MGSVVTSIMREQDLSSLIAPGPNATMLYYKTYDKVERAYQIFRSKNVSVCNSVLKCVEGTLRKNQSKSGGKSTQEK